MLEKSFWMNDNLLYAPYLYLNEDEFPIYPVRVDEAFWKSKDIGSVYYKLFKQKLEGSVELMVYNILQDQFVYDELAEIFKESFFNDFNSESKFNAVKQKINHEYWKCLDSIADLLNADASGFTTLSKEDLGPVILFDYHGFQGLDEFIERLQIIQQDGDIIQHYIDNGLIDSKEEAESFPSFEELNRYYEKGEVNDFSSIVKGIICG